MNPHNHHRRSIRLRGYDYTQPGAYFITMCTHNRECLFGDIANGEMVLNEWGKMVWDEWFKSQSIRNEITLYDNEFAVMPNHIHGIVWIVNTDNIGVNDVGATGRSPLPLPMTQPIGSPKRSLSSFVAGFKSAVTKQINQLRQTPGMPVWQRNYYEHIIRNNNELHRIQQYIINNPKNWELDENYHI